MGGARAVVYLLLLLGLLVPAYWGIFRTSSTTAQDANLVYCLDPAHQDGLVTAAVSLGLAARGSVPGSLTVDGHELTLAGWQAADNADFTRACNAYATANAPQATAPSGSSGGDALDQLFVVLLPVIAGALLTLAVDDVKQSGDRRLEQADELRASWHEFESAVRNYLADSEKPLAPGRPSSSDVDAKRRLLEADLRKIWLRHRRSESVGRLRAMLNDTLGPTMTEGGLAAKTQQIEVTLVAFNDSLEQVASALERAVWLPVRL
jgi:hypothetical protein